MSFPLVHPLGAIFHRAAYCLFFGMVLSTRQRPLRGIRFNPSPLLAWMAVPLYRGANLVRLLSEHSFFMHRLQHAVHIEMARPLS
jgi:hypothetical protein